MHIQEVLVSATPHAAWVAALRSQNCKAMSLFFCVLVRQVYDCSYVQAKNTVQTTTSYTSNFNTSCVLLQDFQMETPTQPFAKGSYVGLRADDINDNCKG